MLEDEVEEPVSKRPRLSSGEQPRTRKVFKQVYQPMKLLDSLSVISAISDCVQISQVAGVVEASEVQYNRDFLISSGNHVKSYLTTALASVPLVCSSLPLKLKIQESEKLKVTRVFSTQNFVFTSYKLDSPER